MWLIGESSFNYRSLKCKINQSRLTSSLLTLGPGSVHCWSVRAQLGGFYVLLLCLALWPVIGLALVNYRFSQEVSNWVLVSDCFFVLNSAWIARRGATIRLQALICLQRPFHFSSVWQQSFLTFTEATGLPLIYVLITGGRFSSEKCPWGYSMVTEHVLLRRPFSIVHLLIVVLQMSWRVDDFRWIYLNCKFIYIPSFSSSTVQAGKLCKSHLTLTYS